MIQLSTLNYVRHRGSLLINRLFFNLHFAATQPTLCNCIGDSLTKSMLNTDFFFFFLLLFHSYFNPMACRSLQASLASLRLFKHTGFFKCETSNVTFQTNEPLFHSYRYATSTSSKVRELWIKKSDIVQFLKKSPDGLNWSQKSQKWPKKVFFLVLTKI